MAIYLLRKLATESDQLPSEVYLQDKDVGEFISLDEESLEEGRYGKISRVQCRGKIVVAKRLHVEGEEGRKVG
jgi:hypothetical protein